nr:MAG TPA: hypothetical protein [Bacteriophage sp.]
MPLSTLIPAAVFTLKSARNLLHDTQIDKSYKEPLVKLMIDDNYIIFWNCVPIVIKVHIHIIRVRMNSVLNVSVHFDSFKSQ